MQLCAETHSENTSIKITQARLPARHRRASRMADARCCLYIQLLLGRRCPPSFELCEAAFKISPGLAAPLLSPRAGLSSKALVGAKDAVDTLLRPQKRHATYRKRHVRSSGPVAGKDYFSWHAVHTVCSLPKSPGSAGRPYFVPFSDSCS